jgi:hypothetical protein
MAEANGGADANTTKIKKSIALLHAYQIYPCSPNASAMHGTKLIVLISTDSRRTRMPTILVDT